MKNNLQVRMQMVEGDPMLCLGVWVGCRFQCFFFALGKSFSKDHGPVENDHVGDYSP